MSLRKMAEEYAEDEVTRAKCCEHCRERAIERKIHLIPAYLAGARAALEMAAKVADDVFERYCQDHEINVRRIAHITGTAIRALAELEKTAGEG